MLHYLPQYNQPKSKHEERQAYHLTAGKSLKSSFESYDNFKPFGHIIKMPSSIALSSNPEWANRHFGAVNTVKESGCVALLAKNILDHMGYDIPMEKLLIEIETKGYRQWKLANNKKTLTIPSAEVSEIKKLFPAEDPIQNCETIEDVYKLYGSPVGIGGSMFLIDNIIDMIAKKPVEIYKDTRIYSVNKILQNLENDIMVPVRVNNSIYHNDPSKTEGHYVILAGILEGKAIIIDSSCEPNGINVIPTSQLFKAMLHDENLICAWDLSPCV